MMTVLVVMVFVVMLSVLLLTLATVSSNRAKREFSSTEDRINAQKIGRDFIAQGVSIDLEAYSDDYVYTVDAEERTLTVKRKNDTTILVVCVDTSGDLVFWREYYR